MNSEIKRISNIIRNFFFSIVNKEFLIFLFFLLLSGAFWLSMALDDTYEKEISVPIRLVDIPRNTIITTEMPDTIVMTVRDKGFAFIGYLDKKRFKPINFSFNTYANNSTARGTVPIADIQKKLYQRLSSSSKIIALKPDQFTFYFNFGLSKQLPIQQDGKIIPAKNYYLAQVKFWPEKVTVYAQKKVLDHLKAIKTERLNIQNFSDTLIKEVKLEKITGVKIVPSTIKIGLYPDVLTEESIEVPIIATNMPEGKTLRTFPAKVKVLFNVGAHTFRNISAKQFKVVVDYNEIQNHTTDKCTLHLRAVPINVQQPRLEISQVDYLIEQQ